jgi:hypothetical protein
MAAAAAAQLADAPTVESSTPDAAPDAAPLAVDQEAADAADEHAGGDEQQPGNGYAYHAQYAPYLLSGAALPPGGEYSQYAPQGHMVVATALDGQATAYHQQHLYSVPARAPAPMPGGTWMSPDSAGYMQAHGYPMMDPSQQMHMMQMVAGGHPHHFAGGAVPLMEGDQLALAAAWGYGGVDPYSAGQGRPGGGASAIDLSRGAGAALSWEQLRDRAVPLAFEKMGSMALQANLTKVDSEGNDVSQESVIGEMLEVLHGVLDKTMQDRYGSHLTRNLATLCTTEQRLKLWEYLKPNLLPVATSHFGKWTVQELIKSSTSPSEIDAFRESFSSEVIFVLSKDRNGAQCVVLPQIRALAMPVHLPSVRARP